MKPSRLIDRLVIPFFFVMLASLAGCNMPARETTTPTLNVTQAYQTVEARLTEAVALTPKFSATSTLRATATPGESTPSPTPVLQTVTPDTPQLLDASCDQALPGVPIDVTIPDDTKLRPGEKFTKTWRLQNVGTCTWTSEYSLVWFSGEQFEAPLGVPINGSVTYGQSVDLSVDMKAPDTTGTYVSYWKLRNPTGGLFGIGPSNESAFWVSIVVEGSPIITGTPTATTTITPTVTPTAGVQVSGPATLELGNLYDLDTNQVNNGGEDLAYQEADQKHVLVPIDNTGVSIFGANQPTLNDCLNISLSSDPITVDNLAGNFICYRTNMALPGWVLIISLDPETSFLNLEIYTWSIP